MVVVMIFVVIFVMIVVMIDDYRNSCLLPAGCVNLTHSNRKGEGGQLFSAIRDNRYNTTRIKIEDAMIKLFSGIHDNFSEAAMIKVMIMMLL